MYAASWPNNILTFFLTHCPNEAQWTYAHLTIFLREHTLRTVLAIIDLAACDVHRCSCTGSEEHAYKQ
jgi:hypothetical protein